MKTNPTLKTAPALPPFKFGPITIPVYTADQTKDGKLYPGFRFSITLGQTRHDVRRGDLDDLRQAARKLVDEYNKGSYSTAEEVVTLTGDKLARYHKLVALESELGRPLAGFLEDEAMRAVKVLVPFRVSLNYVVQDYITRHTGLRPITVKGATLRFLAAKEKKGISSQQLRRYRRLLGYLADKYGHHQMVELTSIRARAFLRGLKRQIKIKRRQRNLQKITNPKVTIQ